MPARFLTRRGFAPPVDQLDPKRYLPFVPQNENGVVYIFALVAERLGFAVKRVQAGYPDCQATWRGKRARIEFEYRSSNFGRHGHAARKCDLVVCWKHDWPRMPAGLAVLELRKLFGLARDVFIVAYRAEFWRKLSDDRAPLGLWSVPASAGVDDLLLIYRPQTPEAEGAITHVYRVHTPPERVKVARWKGGPDWMAAIQQIARLRDPIPFSRLRELRAHGGIEARPRRTDQWPALYRELTDHARPSHSLKRYETL